MQRTHPSLSGALCAAVCLWCAGLTGATMPELKYATPVRGEIHRFVTLPGTIRADQQATLYSRVAGHLKKVHVDIGDTVKDGQLLAEIDVPELEADLLRAKAAVARAEAEKLKAATAITKASVEAEFSQTDAERVFKARKSSPDLITPQMSDDARGRQETAKASLAEARAGETLAAARHREAEAELKRIEALLGFARITAPFDGVVTARHVDAGAFVPAAAASASPNAAVVTLMHFNTVRVSVGVPESESSLVKTGQPVKVSVAGVANRTFAGKVSRQAFALNENTRLLNVEADLPNQGGELRPGMFATVRIGVEKHADAMLIPAGALLTEKNASSVFLLAEGKAKKMAVKTGFNDGVQVEIVGGLTGQEQVLVFGKTPPADGQAVNATEAK